MKLDAIQLCVLAHMVCNEDRLLLFCIVDCSGE
jgi:hypothetical protein